MEKKHSKTPGRHAVPIIAITATVLFSLAVILALWGRRADRIGVSGTSQQAVLDYVTALTVGDFGNINRCSGFTPSLMCSWEDYDNYLLQLFHKDFSDLTIEELKSRSEQQAVFKISKNNTLLTYLHAKRNTLEESWQVYAPLEDDYQPYLISVPAHLTVTVNGIVLSQDNLVFSTLVPGYEHIPADLSAPFFTTYETPPLLGTPDILATSETGVPGQLSIDTKKRMAEAFYSLDDDAHSRQIVETAFQQYAEFMSGEITMKNYLPTLLHGTDFYRQIEDSVKPSRNTSLHLDSIKEIEGRSAQAFSSVVAMRRTSDGIEDIILARFDFITKDGAWLLVGINQLD